jgi:hypothetical protein
MGTTENENKEDVQNTFIEKKREILSVQVTPEEKRQITKMAIKDCGISVSEFVRTKIFLEPKRNLQEDEQIIDLPMQDEERQAYEETIDKLNLELKTLKSDVVKLKVSKVNLLPGGLNTEESENKPSLGVINSLNPDFINTIERVKEYRNKKFEALSDEDKKDFPDYLDFEKFFTTVLLRGFRRMYNNGVLKQHSGLLYEDVKLMASVSNIDFDEV